MLDRIVARTGTDGTTRYTYGAGADTAAAVLDTSNVLVHTTITLPGGVLLSKAAGGQTWSYPNLHGSITAITNAAGGKQGGTFHYDPYGNPISGLPDNMAGDLDYGWLGQHQRPTEHHAGLRTQIDMGARGYDPQLARFLETDPVEGGGDNDYNYPTNPRNQYDLDGRMWTCIASCHATPHGKGDSEGFVYAGPPVTEARQSDACNAAKKRCTQLAPRGHYPRHCKCYCAEGKRPPRGPKLPTAPARGLERAVVTTAVMIGFAWALSGGGSLGIKSR